MKSKCLKDACIVSCPGRRRFSLRKVVFGCFGRHAGSKHTEDLSEEIYCRTNDNDVTIQHAISADQRFDRLTNQHLSSPEGKLWI